MRGFNLAAFGAATAATGLGVSEALDGPEIKKVIVPIKDLHPDLNQFGIVQLSDIHVGSLIQKNQVRRIVELAQSLKPDLVALTGDLPDGSVSTLSDVTSPLKDLTAPFGKFYVTGNHEYYWDVDQWTEQARLLGFDCLFNEHRHLQVKAASITLGGVPDFNCSRIKPEQRSDPKSSLVGAPASDFKILLAHQPRSCFEAFEAGYDLQLSGHTHNGQFFPNNLIVKLFHPYVKGLNLHKDKMWVYVSSGTGFWGPPIRLGVPAEVTHLILTRV